MPNEQQLAQAYAVLQLAPGATPEEIQDAYRLLVRKLHPDNYCHNLDLRSKAEEELKHINAAFRLLRNYPPAERSAPQGSSHEGAKANGPTRPSAEGRSGNAHRRDNSSGPQANEAKGTAGARSSSTAHRSPTPPPKGNLLTKGASFGKFLLIASLVAVLVLVLALFRNPLSRMQTVSRIATPKPASHPAELHFQSQGTLSRMDLAPSSLPPTDLLVGQWLAKAFRIIRVDPQGRLLSFLHTQDEMPASISIDRSRRWLLMANEGSRQQPDGISIYTLGSGCQRLATIPHSKGCLDPVFIPGGSLIAYARNATTLPGVKVEIYDLSQDRVVDRFQGFRPTVPTSDACLFYQTYNGGRIITRRYEPESKRHASLGAISLRQEMGPFDVTELVALSRNQVYARVYDEHEYRYYDPDGREPFPPGLNSYRLNGVSKEQYGLTFSDDGNLAAFTERSWNELTYLCTISLIDGTRRDTSFFGSFPLISEGKIYFLSDPDFVQPESKEFRQIKNFSLYEYDPEGDSIRQIRRFSGSISLVDYVPR